MVMGLVVVGPMAYYCKCIVGRAMIGPIGCVAPMAQLMRVTMGCPMAYQTYNGPCHGRSHALCHQLCTEAMISLMP